MTNVLMLKLLSSPEKKFSSTAFFHWWDIISHAAHFHLVVCYLSFDLLPHDQSPMTDESFVVGSLAGMQYCVFVIGNYCGGGCLLPIGGGEAIKNGKEFLFGSG